MADNDIISIKDYQRPKRTVEQVSLWRAAKTKTWFTCALLPINADHPYFNSEITYKKEEVEHPSYREAMTFLENNYVGRKT